MLHNGALVLDRSDELNLASAISGTGAIQQIGAGATHLSDNGSAFSGSTSLHAGVLSVNGVLGGTLAVLGGRLQGTGTVGATTIAAGGANLSVTNYTGIPYSAGQRYSLVSTRRDGAERGVIGVRHDDAT